MTNPWKPTPFEGEDVRIESVNGKDVYTDIGTFELTFEPLDNNHVRVVRRGNRVVIGYSTPDLDNYGPPGENDEGAGYIYRVDSDQRDYGEFQNALGLDSNYSPDLYEIGDEGEQEAIRRTIQKLLKRHLYGGTVMAIEQATEDGDYQTWHVAITYDDRVAIRTLHASTFSLFEGGFRKSYVSIHGYAEEMEDKEKVEIELWEKGRTEGTIGNKWAVILRKYGENWHAYKPWKDIPWQEYDEARHCAVWVPSDCLVEDIEGEPEDKRWARAVELTKQACETYSDWCNGYIYNSEVESFTFGEHDDALGDEHSSDLWYNDDNQHSCGGIYGYEYVPTCIQDYMDDVLSEIARDKEQ